MTDEEQTFLTLKGLATQLPESEQFKLENLIIAIRACGAGQMEELFPFAIALLGAELAAKD